MADLSISEEHVRTPKKRPYRMRRRAEQVDATRQRITEAAVKLHTTVGPAHTTIAGVAEEAGVTRLTVYRHFDDLDELFAACMGHWFAENPIPDVEAWRAIDEPAERARAAFAELYAWYAQRGDELFPIDRDFETMPDTARAAMGATFDAIADAIIATSTDDGSVRSAVARHLVAFSTWHSLIVEQGLSVEEATIAATDMLLAVGDR